MSLLLLISIFVTFIAITINITLNYFLSLLSWLSMNRVHCNKCTKGMNGHEHHSARDRWNASPALWRYLFLLITIIFIHTIINKDIDDPIIPIVIIVNVIVVIGILYHHYSIHYFPLTYKQNKVRNVSKSHPVREIRLRFTALETKKEEENHYVMWRNEGHCFIMDKRLVPEGV